MTTVITARNLHNIAARFFHRVFSPLYFYPVELGNSQFSERICDYSRARSDKRVWLTGIFNYASAKLAPLPASDSSFARATSFSGFSISAAAHKGMTLASCSCEKSQIGVSLGKIRAPRCWAGMEDFALMAKNVISVSHISWMPEIFERWISRSSALTGLISMRVWTKTNAIGFYAYLCRLKKK